MATPSISDLTVYTATPLNDQDWLNNFTQIVNWLTDGNADFSIKTLTASGNIKSSSGNIVATLGSFVGDGSLLTGIADSAKLNGQLPAYYLARANHTGTQAIATLSDHNQANHNSLNITPGDGTVTSAKIADKAVLQRNIVPQLGTSQYYNGNPVLISGTVGSPQTVLSVAITLAVASKVLVMGHMVANAYNTGLYLYIDGGHNSINFGAASLNGWYIPATIIDYLDLGAGTNTIYLKTYYNTQTCTYINAALTVIVLGNNA